MPAVTFACPECGKVLKSAKPIPAGKKIKCPTCAAVFPMPAQEDEELSAAVSEKPRRPAVAAPPRDDEEEAPRRRKASRAGDDEDEEESRPRRRSRDDEDEDEDRPRRKKGKGPGRRRSGAGLMIAGAAAVLLLLLVGGGVGAYYLWFAGVNRGTGKEEPIAFVPPGSEVIFGADFSTLMNDSVFGPQLEKSFRQQANTGDFLESCKKETGLEFKELFAQTLIASNFDTLNDEGMKQPGGMGGMPPGMPGGGMPPMPGGKMPSAHGKVFTLILKPSRPFDQKKIAKSCKDAVRKKAQGKYYYEVNEGDFRTLYMPSDHILIFSSLSAAELDPVFKSDGTTPGVSADAAALVRSVDRTTSWLVIPFEGQTRGKLDEFLRTDPPPPELKPVVDPAAKGKGVAMWGSLEGEQVKLGVNVACADAAGATQTVQAAETAWNEQKLKVAALGLGLNVMGLAKTAKASGELTGSLKFAAEGTMAKASAGMSRTTLSDAINELQTFQQNNPPGGLPRPGRGPGKR